MTSVLLSVEMISAHRNNTDMSTKTPKQEAEELMNACVPLAKRMLNEHGEFYPYGGCMSQNGDIIHVGAKIEGTNKPNSEPLIDLLRNDFHKSAVQGRCKATAVIFDVRIPLPGSGEKTDAIQVCLDHQDGYSVEVFFPYQIEDSHVTYSGVFAQPGKSLIFVKP